MWPQGDTRSGQGGARSASHQTRLRLEAEARFPVRCPCHDQHGGGGGRKQKGKRKIGPRRRRPCGQPGFRRRARAAARWMRGWMGVAAGGWGLYWLLEDEKHYPALLLDKKLQQGEMGYHISYTLAHDKHHCSNYTSCRFIVHWIISIFLKNFKVWFLWCKTICMSE